MDSSKSYNAAIVGTPTFHIDSEYVDFQTSDGALWRAVGSVAKCQLLHSRIGHGKRIELFRADLDGKPVHSVVLPDRLEISVSQIYCGFVDGMS